MDDLTVDNFALSQARQCFRKYYWRIVMGLVQKDFTAFPLAFGIAVHEALGCSTVDAAVKTFVDVYKEYNPQEGTINEGPRGGLKFSDKRSIIAGVTMIEAYFKAYENDHFETVEQEIGFSFPLTPGIMYTGRIDKVVKAKHSGDLHLMEHKTSSYPMALLNYNPFNQGEGYMVGYEVVRGVKIHSLVVDVFGVFQDTKKYVSKDGAMPTAFDRTIQMRTPEKLDEWVRETAMFSRLILQCMQEDVWPKNSDQCMAYNSLCPYNTLCIASDPEGIISDMFDVDKWEAF